MVTVAVVVVVVKELENQKREEFSLLIKSTRTSLSEHGSKSQYRSSTRTVPRCIGHGVSVAYRPIRKIM